MDGGAGHAHRSGTFQFQAANLIRSRQGRDQPRRHQARIHRIGDIMGNHNEFVAAQSRRPVAAANGAANPFGHLTEQGIPCLMAICVIDGLEIIQGDGEQGDILIILAGTDIAFNSVLEGVAIGKTGQHIMLGHMSQPALRLDPAGHICADAEIADNVASRIEARRGCQRNDLALALRVIELRVLSCIYMYILSFCYFDYTYTYGTIEKLVIDHIEFKIRVIHTTIKIRQLFWLFSADNYASYLVFISYVS